MKIRTLAKACLVLTGTVTIGVMVAYAAETSFMLHKAAELKWTETGPQFPDTHLVILEGDPGKKQPVTLRWRCPASYKFMPHTHPGAERITVLSGTMLVALGAKYDAAGLKEVQAGDFLVLPKEPHYGECKTETILEIDTMGPLGTTYVNPADDPSRKK
jgi:quercetin dioxygenase-like cupin family protein